MPIGADIITATDADAAGERLHEQLVAATARPLRRHRAPVPKDWNDYLQALDRGRRGKGIER